MHFACQALLAGECDLALAGAANVPVPQLSSYLYESGMVFSSDGYCRAFDARADGTVFGSGVGVVALKPLAEAVADGDPVYAVIKGTAVNNDGARKVGMTAPGVSGQAAVVAEALRVAEVPAETVGYVETHGTGTALGDPIEIEALTRAFGSAPGASCAIGSVKTNIGHLGWAAGMASLIKAVFALRHGQLPPSLHFTEPNPRIGFADSPFFVNTSLRDWPSPVDAPRRAGVSAFGLGGTNAHVVLEEPPALPAVPAAERDWQVLTLSARTPAALRDLTARYRQHLVDHPEQDLADMANSANTGRRHHEYRAAVVADSPRRAAAELAGRPSTGGGDLTPPRVAMLFTGYRADIAGVGATLYRTSPVFRETVDLCSAVYRDELGVTAAEVLYGGEHEGDRTSWLARAQPAQFAVQLGLVELWRSWGVEPAAVLGHSLGEFAAACAAGVFDIATGAHLVATRARLLSTLPDGGAMMAVGLGEHDAGEEIARYADAVSVAASNGPANTVVAGRADALRDLGARLDARGIQVKDLGYGGAGHSPDVDGVLDEFEHEVGLCTMGAPRSPIVSDVTGELIGDLIGTSGYWRRQLREPVRFATGVRSVAAAGADAFVEIGSVPVLLGMAGAVLPDHPGPWLPSLRPGRPDWAELGTALGRLYELGADIDWAAVSGPEQRRRLHLPTYPFQRRRYWIDAPDREPAAPPRPTEDWRSLVHEPVWRPAPAPRRGPDAEPTRGTVIVFADRYGIGDAVADRLRSDGRPCVVVRREEGFAGELLDTVPGPIEGVVHLWSLETPALPDSTAALAAAPDSVVAAAATGAASVVELVKALAARDDDARPALVLVTSNVHVVGESDRADGVAQAPLWGLAKIAAMEHPELSFVRVDLDGVDDPAARAAELLGELDGVGGEREVALRAGVRHVRRLVRAPAADQPARLRADACYLVVGGVRGLGVLAAERLSAAGAGTVVLVGRGAPTAEVTERLDRMRAQGTRVVVERADIADQGAVAGLFDRIAELGVPLRGVVHTAAILDDGVLRSLDWTRFGPVFAPKAQGAWNLHVWCRERGHDLDFCLYFSSATALVGNSGQANYAAANTFLDALAHHRRANGRPAVAVNWGAWAGAGFLADQAGTMAQIERSGMGAFSASQGAAAFDHLLAGTAAQVGILPTRWPTFLRWHGLHGDPFFTEVTDEETAPPQEETVGDRIAGAAGEPRRELILDHVRELAGQLLGVAAAEDDEHLVRLGMDSLSAIQLRNRLQSTLDCQLPTTLCFQHPSISAIAEYLDTGVLTDRWRTSARRAAPGVEPVSRPTTTSETLPLSTQQRRWLMLRRIGYGQLVTPIMFEAALDRTAFRDALATVVGRHDVLRCRFDEDAAHLLPVEEALPADDVLFVDLADLPMPGRAERLAELGQAAREDMPDPATSVPWAIRAVRLDEGRFLVLLSSQHLEFDGVSVSVFVDELRESYRRAVAGEPPLADVPTQYGEFVRWQADYLAGDVVVERAFFTGLHATGPGRTLLPGHSGGRATEGHRSGRLTPPVRAELWPRLQDAAQQANVSPFALLCAVYLRLVAELSGRPDVTVGTIVTGRSDERFARTIGPFVAPFPISVPSTDRPVGELARLCNRLVAAINERCAYPPVDLVTHVPPFDDLPEDTYFTDPFIMFNNYQREEVTARPRVEVLECLAPLSDPELAGLDAPTLVEIAGLFLIIDIWEGEPRFNFWYHLHRFTADQVGGWASRYLDLLGSALDELVEPRDLAA